IYRHLLLPESGFTPVGLVDLPIRQLSRPEPYSATLRCQFAERRGQKSEPVFSAALRLWDEQIASPLLDDGSIEFEFAFHNGDEADLKPGSRRPDKSAHQGLPNGIVFLCSDHSNTNAMTASRFMPCSKGQPERRASIKA